MLQNKVVLVIVVAVVGALGGGIATFAIGLPASPCAGVVTVPRSFTLVAGSTGYNDSKDHLGSWPVLNVNRCDFVKITVVDSDVQAHGFAVDYYAARGAEVLPQQPVTVQFQATRAGQFRVYCNIPCTYHFFMQNGLLNVT